MSTRVDMPSYYRHYYQTYYNRSQDITESKIINKFAKDKARTTTQKQYDYYKSLLDFLRQKGCDTSSFDNPKSKYDISSYINGIITVLRKNGWVNEFFGKS